MFVVSSLSALPLTDCVRLICQIELHVNISKWCVLSHRLNNYYKHIQ